MTIATSTFDVEPSADRYYGDHGWLKTYHSFSFAEYFNRAKTHWGALRVFNDDRIAGGQGFPTHPHQNMEILTYVLEGKLEHRDTLGSHGIVEAGGVQYLSAGTGIRHSESNATPDQPLHLIQMWVLPGQRDARPTYGQVDFDRATRHNRWLAVASGEGHVEAPIRLTQTATLRVAQLENVPLSYAFGTGRLGFLFVGSGAAEATARDRGGQSHRATLSTGDAIRMSDLETLELTGHAELVFWDIPPINEAD